MYKAYQKEMGGGRVCKWESQSNFPQIRQDMLLKKQQHAIHTASAAS